MDQLLTFLEKHWGKVTNLEVREHNEVQNRKRDELKRDYARVIYSTSFRRQQGKMQLFEVNSKAFHRNRLTHSFEVAQIARGIVDELKNRIENNDNYYNDDEERRKKIEENFIKMSIVVETGALIHDIGNPPFGHHGERVLNSLASDIGFEGNAQGIRVLRKIEKKSPEYNGLNLTYRTLAAIIKYFVPYDKVKDKKKKKCLYTDDYNDLLCKLKKLGYNEDLPFRTIDVQIVDLADEIAYCAHDLEDALASNYFTIDEFIFRLKSKLNKQSKDDFEGWVESAKCFAEQKGDVGLQSEDYDFYFRRELISIIVNKLIEDINVITVDDDFQTKTGTKNKEELGFKNYKDLAEALKTTIFKCVTSSDNIMLYEKVGTKILTKLFELFMNDEYNEKGMLMPVEYRWNSEDSKETKARKVLDYISGMMDTYAIEVYMKHFGEDPFNVKYDGKIFGSPKK
jgi:putative dGTPase